jgi:hypothetical protein
METHAVKKDVMNSVNMITARRKKLGPTGVEVPGSPTGRLKA